MGCALGLPMDDLCKSTLIKVLQSCIGASAGCSAKQRRNSTVSFNAFKYFMSHCWQVNKLVMNTQISRSKQDEKSHFEVFVRQDEHFHGSDIPSPS